MKKNIFLLLSAISLIIFCSGSCKKNKDSPCKNVTSKGRIIGYNPCLHYLTFNKVKDAGFVIEIDNGNTKDTVATYGIPEGIFNFLPSYISGSYSTYLFRPEVQDLFKLKFNYRFADLKEMTVVICSGLVYPADFLEPQSRKKFSSLVFPLNRVCQSEQNSILIIAIKISNHVFVTDWKLMLLQSLK